MPSNSAPAIRQKGRLWRTRRRVARTPAESGALRGARRPARRRAAVAVIALSVSFGTHLQLLSDHHTHELGVGVPEARAKVRDLRGQQLRHYAVEHHL
jgi:hypothetical protein